MQTMFGPGLPVGWFCRPLNHGQQITAFLVMALVVCGGGIVRGQLSDTGGSKELQPNLERGKGSTIVKGGPGSESGHISVPVELARSLEAAPHLGISDVYFDERQGGGKGWIPRCYSSPGADPSEGVWQRAKGGVSESPAMRGNWTFPDETDFNRVKLCTQTWREEHHGDQEMQPYWVWKPSSCKLNAVNTARFCRVMEGRKGVLLVGDSLTRLATTTLASILRAKPITISLMEDEWSACDGKLAVRFMRNDYLDVRKLPFETEHCNDENGEPVRGTHCGVFADNDTLQNFDTLVVNSGAHIRPPEVYGPAMNVVSESLAASMKYFHGDDAILVVRNTVPGHYHCTERMFDGPTNRTVAIELVSGAPEKFEWNHFRDFNVLLTEAFSPENGWAVLDAYTPTLLRPDSHIGGKDCLHYCVPGPADHWIVLLYNMLLNSPTWQ